MRFLLLCAMLSASALSQTARVTALLEKATTFAGIALSPDGKRIAWTQTLASQSQPRLWVGTVGGVMAPVPVFAGAHQDSDPAWSPDSRTLAFFSTAGEQDQAQLWTWSPDSVPKKRTRLKGYAARPRWSPDGKKVAFLYLEGGAGGGPLEAAEVQTGVIRQEIRNQRIAVLDLATGRVARQSPETLYIYDFDWAPNSADFVTTGAPGPGDNNWWVAQLYVIRDGVARSIHKTKWQLAVPRFSPDGTQIAFVEGLMSDEGFHGGDLMLIPAAGGEVRNLTAQRPTSPSAAVWLDNGRLLLTEASKGGSAVAELTLATGETTTRWEGAEDVHAFGNFPNFALSRDGQMSALIRSTFTAPPEIAVGPVGQWKPVTRSNAAIRPEWGEAESVSGRMKVIAYKAGWCRRPRWKPAASTP